MAPIVGRFGSMRGGRDGAIAQLGERVVRNDEVGGSIPPGSTTLRPSGFAWRSRAEPQRTKRGARRSALARRRAGSANINLIRLRATRGAAAQSPKDEAWCPAKPSWAKTGCQTLPHIKDLSGRASRGAA